MGREHKKRLRLSCETPFRSPLQAATLLGNIKRVRQDSNKKLPLVGLVNIVTEYRLCELSRGGYPPCEMLPARLCQVLEQSMNKKILRENSLISKSATERYLDLKNEYPGIEKRVNQTHIASYLGITPVSLSRIRRVIREEN